MSYLLVRLTRQQSCLKNKNNLKVLGSLKAKSLKLGLTTQNRKKWGKCSLKAMNYIRCNSKARS